MASYEGFDQLYPTNHIHFGYMDRMSWKNMNHFAFGLQLRPNKDSHFEVTGHFFSLKEEATAGIMPVKVPLLTEVPPTPRPILGKKSTWSIPTSSPLGTTWLGKSAAVSLCRVTISIATAVGMLPNRPGAIPNSG